MDYKDLANLIFPDAKEISYYEEKYPERNLTEGAVVTRFAPSPTGFVHIGGLYQALVARTIAEKTGGVFFLRVEDTDQKREVENGVTGIVNSLKDFDMAPDEGMISDTEEIGNYGPYKQSLRKDIYQAYAKYMIEQGKAYPCFCTPEDLDEIRQKQEAAKLRTGYYGVWAKCRNLSVEEMAEKIKAGEPYIIRFKSPGREDRKIKHKDVIKGNVDFPENDQDIVIIKADGLPTYHFAHAIDDYLMRTTDVIRGEEWLSSLPIHVQLFDVLGFERPNYAHIPTIMKQEGGSKRKLSKRKDAEAAVSYYNEVGYPVVCVIEYLLNIVNSSYEEWRTENPSADYHEFVVHLDKMSKSGALFDLVKLNDVSKDVIARMPASEVYEKYTAWAKEYDKEMYELVTSNEAMAREIFNIDKEGPKPRKDFAKWDEVKDKIFYFFDELFYNETAEQVELPKTLSLENAKAVIEEYAKKFTFNVGSQEEWFEELKVIGAELGYCANRKEYKANPENYKGMISDVAGAVRSALSHRTNTPDLYTIMQIMGEEKVRERFNKFLAL